MYNYCYRMGGMGHKPLTSRRLCRRVFSQLWMLALQFVLGMVLNLIGSGATGAKYTIYSVVLVSHILNAIGLVEGGLYLALKGPSKLSWWAAATISATFCAGILTEFTQQDVWSFVMACGFVASSWLYGALYVRADRSLLDGTKAS